MTLENINHVKENMLLDWTAVNSKEYKKLLADQKLLNALFAVGVDNWEGYERAQEVIDE